MNRALLHRFATVVSVFVAIAAGNISAATTANGPYYATPSWDQTLPSNTRFIVLSNFSSQAVLDRETGLVWEKAPNPTTETWYKAQERCIELIVGNRRGWRLPSISELASLHDPSVSPLLPAGHPFENIQLAFSSTNHYWSATTVASNVDRAWALNYFNGAIERILEKTSSYYVWCVRGGAGTDAQ